MRRPRAATARTALMLTGAIGQVVLPSLILPRLRREIAPADVLQPAPYAFSVWLPIYALALSAAVQQVRRPGDVPAEIGWPLAGAFTTTTVWAPLLRGGRDWSAQAALFGTAGFAEVARSRVADQRDLDPGTRALLVGTTGTLAAWGAAATAVNLGAMLVAYGPEAVRRRSTPLGVALTLSVGALATARTRATGVSDPTSRTYAATVLWALTGIVVGQRRTTPAVAAAAVLAAAPVVAAIAPRRSAG